MTAELVHSAYVKEVSSSQHFVEHDDVQTSPQAIPLVVRTILDGTDAVLEMERLAQNPNFLATQAEIDENGDKVLVVYEPTQSNPNVQHDLNLWRRVRDYDKANAELPFTPVLSRKQKQQVRKQFQIGKSPPYKTRGL